MNNKRVLGIFLLGVFILSMMGGVFAQLDLPDAPSQGSFGDALDSVAGGIESAYDALSPLLNFIVGETDNVSTGDDAQLFFVKLLFFILIFSLVWIISDRIPTIQSNGFVKFIVGFIVAFLAIRGFANSDILYSVMLPYNVLGVTMISAIPFIIAFFAIKDFSRGWKKIAWIFFTVVFVALWIIRSEDVGSFAWIYLITAALGVITLLMDKTIQRWWRKQEAENMKDIRHDKERRRILREANQLDEDLANHILTSAQHRQNFDRLKRDARSFGLDL